MRRQPRIADASQLEFRMIHGSDVTGWIGASPMATGFGGQG